MKILYIYHDYKKRRKKYGEIMSKLGHDVSYRQMAGRSKRKVLKSDIGNVDLVWILKASYISEGFIGDGVLGYLKKRKIPIACYATFNTTVPYPKMVPLMSKIDYSFIQNKAFANHLSECGQNAHYIPLGYHDDQFAPLTRKKKYDITFAGNPQSHVKEAKHDMRVRYVNALKPLGIKVFGEKFIAKGVKASKIGTHKEHREVFASTKVNLELSFVNPGHPFYSDVLHLKNRFFEIPAVGSFMLANDWDEGREIFGDDAVAYYNSIESMKELAARYLKDTSQRQKMAATACRIVTKHTYTNRFIDMFKIINR